MESIYRLVDDSMARHGFEAKNPEGAPLLPGVGRSGNQEPRLDHLRLNWSRWIRCESSFIFALAPAQPGIIALGEEMLPVGSEGKRMLALFQISETDDLGMALGRLFLPGNPLREQLASGLCFVRYAVIEDAAQRSAATAVFQRWMQESAETASGIQQLCGADTPVRAAETENQFSPDSDVDKAVPPSISSAWGAGFMEVQNREASEAVRRPQPLPSGF